MLPLLGMLPYNFLPAGVAFFIPALCVLTALSACAHIVIVYLAWYLKVGTFEEVFETVAGRWGLHVGRGAIVIAAVGVLISWVESEYARQRD
jgi:amino acid permease